MTTPTSRRLTLIAVMTIAAALLASLTLLPGRASATTGRVLTGSTITFGSTVATLTADCEFDDTVTPWSCEGLYADSFFQADIALLSDSITYTSSTSFTMNGNILLEFATTNGNCTLLFNTPSSVTLTLSAGATYMSTLTNYTYVLDGCGPLLSVAINSLLLGPSAPLTPITFDFSIHPPETPTTTTTTTTTLPPAADILLAGSTMTLGGLGTITLTSDCVLDDTVSPWACEGFYASTSGGVDIALLANSTTSNPPTSFTMSGNILFEINIAMYGSCTLLILTPSSIVLSLAAGATYTSTLTTYTYRLDACSPLMTAGMNGALLGPDGPFNPITFDFAIH